MAVPYEIELMEQIAEHLKIWFQEDPGDKYYPSGTVALRLRNGISLAVELVSFEEVLTWLRVNDQKEVALSLEQERDSFLSHLQAVEQAIERGDNPPLDLIELRSKITGLIGTLEHTAKVFTDNLTPKQPAETGQGNKGQVKQVDKLKATKDKSKKTQEQLLAIKIINALNEWISVGSIENWIKAGSHEYITKRKLPKEYHPNHYLKYRLRIRDKLWMDSIILKLKARGKDGLAEDIEQRQWKFISEVSTIDKNLESTSPMHLPNRQLVSSAARLANALKEALPCLGTQLSEVTPAETGRDTTPTIGWRLWSCVKRIPRWIYVLVIFLAALLTCIYLVWWLWTKFSA